MKLVDRAVTLRAGARGWSCGRCGGPARGFVEGRRGGEGRSFKDEVTARCDVAVTNAGHGTTMSFLLAGKPCLVVPRFVEQGLFAERIQRQGVGRIVLAQDSVQLAKVLDEFLGDGKYRVNSQTFAAKYAGFTPGGQIPALVDHLERLLLLPNTSVPSK